MRNFHFFPIACLALLLFTGLSSQLAAQQVHTVQSTAPALNMPAKELPTTPVAGEEIRPAAAGEVHGVQQNSTDYADPAVEQKALDAVLGRQLTPAEIEELKDGK